MTDFEGSELAFGGEVSAPPRTRVTTGGAPPHTTTADGAVSGVSTGTSTCPSCSAGQDVSGFALMPAEAGRIAAREQPQYTSVVVSIGC
jgi:hypothetical protein